MNEGDIRESLGRIEQKIDNMTDRFDRQHHALYGPGGMEERLRRVETETATMKAKVATVSGFIAALIAGLWNLVQQLFGGKH